MELLKNMGTFEVVLDICLRYKMTMKAARKTQKVVYYLPKAKVWKERADSCNFF